MKLELTNVVHLKQDNKSEVNDIWGGRFTEGPADVMTQINTSLPFDQRLAVHDLLASKVHTQMLACQGIITQEDAQTILSGLEHIAREIKESKTFQLTPVREDIHTTIDICRAPELCRYPGLG